MCDMSLSSELCVQIAWIGRGINPWTLNINRHCRPVQSRSLAGLVSATITMSVVSIVQDMAPPREIRPVNHHKGDSSWFHEEKGLNKSRYRLGAPEDHIDFVPNSLVDEAMCARRWGPRKHGSSRYAKPGCGESPRMCYRLEKLHQISHQRPMGK